MNRVWRLMIVVASMFVDPRSRARHREQWLADLEGAAEAGLAPSGVVLGVFRTVPFVRPRRGAPMPIGPLAIALRRTRASQSTVAVIASFAAVLLVVGIGLLALGQ